MIKTCKCGHKFAVGRKCPVCGLNTMVRVKIRVWAEHLEFMHRFGRPTNVVKLVSNGGSR